MALEPKGSVLEHSKLCVKKCFMRNVLSVWCIERAKNQCLPSGIRNTIHIFKATHGTRFLGLMAGFGYQYFLKANCELYFEKHARQIISLFLLESYRSIEDAILETGCFLELWNGFEKWFDDRRNKFMENMKTDIQEIRSLSTRKTPQSHGGVANLLKVLTKTMEKQGSDIASIAKVQYAICVQAGIYIPDEFIRDVAVTLDMPINNAESEGAECQE